MAVGRIATGSESAEAGLGESAKEARGHLIQDNLALASKLAHRFAHRGEPYDELLQVASLGLVKAADRFDPSRGVAFTTFATHMIVGELKHHFRDSGWAVRAPRRLQELYMEVNAAVSELYQHLGRSPTVREIAELCGRRDDEVLAAIEAGKAYRAESLDAQAADGSTMLERFELDGRISTTSDRSETWPDLSHLSARDQTLVRLRFVEGLTQSQIAERLGISQMHVSRLLGHALIALRSAYGTRR